MPHGRRHSSHLFLESPPLPVCSTPGRRDRPKSSPSASPPRFGAATRSLKYASASSECKVCLCLLGSQDDGWEEQEWNLQVVRWTQRSCRVRGAAGVVRRMVMGPEERSTTTAMRRVVCYRLTKDVALGNA
ncbi:uncharacterized protein [Triticum aestivum]|uniref:uncharacterized protein n=1 Tax=Triticum aestivum TaxID=4565 RepID=UPI001D00614A|nr:uncharacterized protein LOC123091423 [Triticum aestivum]